MTEKPTFKKIAEEFSNTRGFKKIEFVGKGAFKETYKVTLENGQNLALKIADPEKCDAHRSEREISALQRCDTPLIGKLHDFGKFQSHTNARYLFFLEEYLDGGTLTDKIRHGVLLSPDKVKAYAISLVQALDYLRRINLVHRDIKPDNIISGACPQSLSPISRFWSQGTVANS
ncbi:MAG: protein kinase [bacterium]|nr:protein kinase [bacterium]